MALTKDITWMDFDVPAAYAAIEVCNASKLLDGDGSKYFSIVVSTNVWKDSSKAVCLYGIQDTVTLPYNDGTVSIADLYGQLKTLPDWSGWADA